MCKSQIYHQNIYIRFIYDHLCFLSRLILALKNRNSGIDTLAIPQHYKKVIEVINNIAEWEYKTNLETPGSVSILSYAQRHCRGYFT